MLLVDFCTPQMKFPKFKPIVEALKRADFTSSLLTTMHSITLKTYVEVKHSTHGNFGQTVNCSINEHEHMYYMYIVDTMTSNRSDVHFSTNTQGFFLNIWTTISYPK